MKLGGTRIGYDLDARFESWHCVWTVSVSARCGSNSFPLLHQPSLLSFCATCLPAPVPKATMQLLTKGQNSKKKKTPPKNPSFPKSSRPFPTSNSPKTADTFSRATISRSRFGTLRWKTSPSRRSISTSTCGASCAICTRMIVFLTSLSVLLAGMASECCSSHL